MVGRAWGQLPVWPCLGTAPHLLLWLLLAISSLLLGDVQAQACVGRVLAPDGATGFIRDALDLWGRGQQRERGTRGLGWAEPSLRPSSLSHTAHEHTELQGSSVPIRATTEVRAHPACPEASPHAPAHSW